MMGKNRSITAGSSEGKGKPGLGRAMQLLVLAEVCSWERGRLTRSEAVGETLIVRRGEQSADDKKRPRRRVGHAPVEQPREKDDLHQRIRGDEDSSRQVALHFRDPADDHEADPRQEKDNPQPCKDSAGAADEHVTGGLVHAPPRDSPGDDRQRNEARYHLASDGLEKFHPLGQL